MLGRRRLGRTVLLDAVAAEIASAWPGIPLVQVRTGSVPLSDLVPAGGPAVFLIYSLDEYSDLEEQTAALPAGTVVLCGQELCHQVPAVFRLR
ncbi:MAG: hypothetical protein WCQ63_03555 [Methanomethylophilus sp.]